MARLSRPRIHFFHAGSWINDPNGLVFADGVYHLFYQLNPEATKWDNIHWGHAVSKDAVNWSVDRPALIPDEQTGLPFSGSAVFTPFSGDGAAPAELLALYTRSLPMPEGNFEEQYLARFDTRSNRFEPVQAGPVIANPGLADFRDPKLWRLGDQWYVVVSAGDHLRFFQSGDLTNWTETSRFYDDVERPEGVWECPDLLRFRTVNGGQVDLLIVSVAVHGSAQSSNVLYYVGDFDGQQFTPKPGTSYRPVDYGKDFYAVQSWSGLSSDSPLATGWLGNWAYSHDLKGDRFRGCLSIPRTLELQRNGGSWQLVQNPVVEISSLYQPPATPIRSKGSRTEWELDADTPFLMRGSWLVREEGSLEIAIGDQEDNWFLVSFSFKGTTGAVVLDRRQLWDTGKEEEGLTRFVVERSRELRPVDVRLFVDTCCVELFLDGGKTTATELAPWHSGERRIVISGVSKGKGGATWEVIPLTSMSIQ